MNAKTGLLLASCEGDTWAFQVESDEEVREIVADEMFGGGDAATEHKEEIDSVVSDLLENGECMFEDGGFKLMPGGVRINAERVEGSNERD